MKENSIPKRSYKTTLTEVQRFWNFVDKTSYCWLWTGTQVGKGYGYFRINNPRKKILAHRYSYQLHFGKFPEYLQVMHICDNPLCVNPKHLKTGTNMDNVKDMMNKGRNPKGENHYKRKRYLEKINDKNSSL